MVVGKQGFRSSGISRWLATSVWLDLSSTQRRRRRNERRTAGCSSGIPGSDSLFLLLL